MTVEELKKEKEEEELKEDEKELDVELEEEEEEEDLIEEEFKETNGFFGKRISIMEIAGFLFRLCS